MIYRTKFQGEQVEIEYGIDAYGEFYVEGAWYVPSEIQLDDLEQHDLIAQCKAGMIEKLGWQFSTPDADSDAYYSRNKE